MHLGELLERARNLYPNKVGVKCYHKQFTYEEFYKRVCKLCGFLFEKGITSECNVGILSYNCHAFLETYYACAVIGAGLVPINYRLSSREIRFILEDSGCTFLISHWDFREKVKEWLSNRTSAVLWIEPEIPQRSNLDYEHVLATFDPSPRIKWGQGDDHVAQIYYTSGTTGRQKGVILSHKNCYVHALAAIAELDLKDHDVWIHVAPMFHLADAWATWAITWVGGTHVMVKQFKPSVVLATMEKEKVTITNMVPTMLNMLVNDPDFRNFRFPSLRAILSGGSPISPQLARKIVEGFGCDYIQTYGMTETSPYLTVSILKEHLKSLPPQKQFEFKVKTGRPFLGVSLRVVRNDGSDVRNDGREVGEIIVKGDTITKGYWKLPEENKKAFRDGWFCTGDLAVVDEEGYVNIVDRKKDMIITGGENVYSIEVENALYEHPKILEVAVFGIPDEKWGEAVHAAVVLKPGETATEEEIISFCKEKVAHYKAPKSVTFMSKLPKTGSGKIHKKALRDKFWNQ